MPKKKPASKKATDIKNLAKYGVAALLILTGISLVIYLPPTLKQRDLENKFTLLDKDVDSLKAELDAKFPDKTFEKDKYCTNYSGELFKGPLHCDIVLRSKDIFSVSDLSTIEQVLSNSNSWQEKVHLEINKSGFITPGVYQDIKTGYKCQLDFVKGKDTKSLKLNYFWCQDLSKRSFYPYRN